jgi:antitoxin VapB
MALNIKDPATQALAAEVAALSGETKTGAVREALRERRDRLRGEAAAAHRAVGVRRFLLEEAWPQVPDEVRRRPLSKAEREAVLGYGAQGV